MSDQHQDTEVCYCGQTVATHDMSHDIRVMGDQPKIMSDEEIAREAADQIAYRKDLTPPEIILAAIKKAKAPFVSELENIRNANPEMWRQDFGVDVYLEFTRWAQDRAESILEANDDVSPDTHDSQPELSSSQKA